MLIRPATRADSAAIWSIIGPTIRAGETYAIDRDLPEADAIDYWLAADKQTFLVTEASEVLGSYYLRANQSGGGSHVCNCGYMTAPGATGRGVARRMYEHSVETARAQGFRAMQFNFVVSTNERAIALWTRLGLEVVGRLPLAFRHPREGYVDALVMFRSL